MDYVNLNSFLKFGYFLKYTNPNYNIHLPEKLDSDYKYYEESELIKIGSSLFGNAINKQFKSNNKNLVPLSGGLDSRAILAQLLKNTSASNIYTYTFGIPGSLDYEIGNKVAKKLGTKHHSINLQEYNYSIEELIDISNRIDHQTVLFYHPPIWMLDDMYNEFTIWSGTIIDVYYGRHFHKIKSENLIEAKKNFIRENNQCNLTLTKIPDEDFLNYIDIDKKASKEINLEHHIDLYNRQIKYIAPHVLINGFDYNVLFNDVDLVNFSFAVNFDWIEHQYLYKKILENSFPEIFKWKTKSDFGTKLSSSIFKKYVGRTKIKTSRKLNKISPHFIDLWTNYKDFSWEIRRNKSFQLLLKEQLHDLQNRKILDSINITKIFNDHLTSKKNNYREILILASLEIHLKAGKEI